MILRGFTKVALVMPTVVKDLRKKGAFCVQTVSNSDVLATSAYCDKNIVFSRFSFVACGRSGLLAVEFVSDSKDEMFKVCS